MRDLAILFIHLVATVARLFGPGGARSIVADLLLVKHQLLILNGWCNTGDIGTLNAAGYLQISGRVDDLIIRGGNKFHPSVVEAEMMRHPAVLEVAVVGRPASKSGHL